MKSLFAWLVLLATVSPVCAATLHTDTFQSDGELGWDGGFPTPMHVPTGGPAGEGDGYIKIVVNETAGHVASYNFSADWSGDYQAIGATRVTADLMNPLDSAPLQVHLVLFSTLGGRWVSTTGYAIPADGEWRNYIFGISEQELFQAQGFETYAQMISSVDRVMLRHQSTPDNPQGTAVINPYDFRNDFSINNLDLTDPTSGFNARFGLDLDGAHFLGWQRARGTPVGTLNADNIQLAAAPAVPIPEPTAFVLAGGAIATLVVRAPRSRARWGSTTPR